MTDINAVLRDLSAADRKTARFAQKLRKKPREISNDQAIVSQQEHKLAQAKQKLKDLQLKNRQAEKSLADKEADLLKVKGLQNSAKSNDEFAAHGRRIDTLGNEISELETSILELFDEIEGAEQAISTQQERLNAANAQLKVSSANIDAEVAELQAELDKIEATRQEIMDRLSGEDKGRYLTAFKSHQYDAIATISSGMCQGCHVSVRPNDRVGVESGKSVVFCSNCGRVMHA